MQTQTSPSPSHTPSRSYEPNQTPPAGTSVCVCAAVRGSTQHQTMRIMRAPPSLDIASSFFLPPFLSFHSVHSIVIALSLSILYPQLSMSLTYSLIPSPLSISLQRTPSEKHPTWDVSLALAGAPLLLLFGRTVRCLLQEAFSSSSLCSLPPLLGVSVPRSPARPSLWLASPQRGLGRVLRLGMLLRVERVLLSLRAAV